MQLKLGQNRIEETEKHQYLGEMNKRSLNLKDQIKSIEGKVEQKWYIVSE